MKNATVEIQLCKCYCSTWMTLISVAFQLGWHRQALPFNLDDADKRCLLTMYECRRLVSFVLQLGLISTSVAFQLGIMLTSVAFEPGMTLTSVAFRLGLTPTSFVVQAGMTQRNISFLSTVSSQLLAKATVMKSFQLSYLLSTTCGISWLLGIQQSEKYQKNFKVSSERSRPSP